MHDIEKLSVRFL
ncbi:Protein of unknown function [Bacillus cereus]|uniref:Uncharacterized protein n=1 Tax=Bacillus wiedmannii TaxID=1890302 RepID=A0A1C3ZR41_9BACI|nr:Protein of unknown function [Bacillus wiedmannii]SCB86105.1 Protein of unknown function [Bacillus cereus]SCB84917.1 Protein of unknown function [Bacillus wiedmannii]SCM91046.1 Protein of unknown function [Bacillus cereus]SCN04571.1 Protein of unknown function [Bacillus wiedmannii]